MTDPAATPPLPEAAEPPAIAAKRRQILDGARRAFFAAGYEATSMGEVARAAGVSKGTLYVYFDSKEALFSALVEAIKQHSAEQRTPLDTRHPDVARVLTDFAAGLIRRMADPQNIQLLRMVIGVADRIPAPAQSFYEAGPAHGVRMLADYLAALEAEGRIEVGDARRAAWLFLSMALHPMMTGLLLGGRPEPDAAKVRHLARVAVEAFLAAHPLRG